jgi:hypothetical protein
MGYPTPDNLPTERVCREIFIPDDPLWLAVYNGLLSSLAKVWMWEKIGALTPQECADAAAAIYYEFVESECTDPPMAFPEMVRVRSSVDLSVITNNATVVVVYNTVDYDPTGMFNPAAAGRLTVATAGKYLIVGSVRWAAFVGMRDLTIRQNGINTLAASQQTTTNSATFIHQCTALIDLAAGDYIQLATFQNSGATQTIQAVSRFAPSLAMHRVG